MVEPALVAAGLAVTALASGYLGYQKGKTDGIGKGRELAQREEPRPAHEDATEREPPVESATASRSG